MALTDQLLSYWNLDESSGDANDSVSTYDLTNTGGVSYAAGKINNGAAFSGGMRLRTTGNFLNQIATDFSLNLWINPTTLSSYSTVVDGATKLSFFINSTTDGFFYVGTSSGGLSFSPAWGTSAWQMLTLTLSGTTLTVYRNGTSVATATASALGSPNQDLNFGQAVTGVGGSDWSGGMDEIGIWSRALSGAEITSLYNSGAGLAYPFSGGSPPPPQTATPGVATMTISGVAPASSGTGTATATPGVGTVTLTGVAPAASGTGTATATSGVGTVTVSGVSPASSGSGTATATPGVGVVTVSGIDPTATGGGTQSASPGAATVTVTGVAPACSASGSVTTTPGVALVTLTGVAPAASPSGSATATPGTATVTVSGVGPSPTGIGIATATSGVAVVTVVCTAPTAGVPTVVFPPGGVCVAGVVYPWGAVAGTVYAAGAVAGRVS